MHNYSKFFIAILVAVSFFSFQKSEVKKVNSSKITNTVVADTLTWT